MPRFNGIPVGGAALQGAASPRPRFGGIPVDQNKVETLDVNFQPIRPESSPAAISSKPTFGRPLADTGWLPTAAQDFGTDHLSTLPNPMGKPPAVPDISPLAGVGLSSGAFAQRAVDAGVPFDPINDPLRRGLMADPLNRVGMAKIAAPNAMARGLRMIPANASTLMAGFLPGPALEGQIEQRNIEEQARQEQTAGQGFMGKTLTMAGETAGYMGGAAALGPLAGVGMGAEGAGQMFKTMTENGVDRRIALPVSMAAGAIYAKIEQMQNAIPFLKNEKLGRDMAERWAAGFLSKLNNRGFAAKLATRGVRVGITGGIELGEGVLQEADMVLAETIASMASDGAFGTESKSPEFAEAMQRLGGSAGLVVDETGAITGYDPSVAAGMMLVGGLGGGAGMPRGVRGSVEINQEAINDQRSTAAEAEINARLAAYRQAGMTEAEADAAALAMQGGDVARHDAILAQFQARQKQEQAAKLTGTLRQAAASRQAVEDEAQAGQDIQGTILAYQQAGYSPDDADAMAQADQSGDVATITRLEQKYAKAKKPAQDARGGLGSGATPFAPPVASPAIASGPDEATRRKLAVADAIRDHNSTAKALLKADGTPRKGTTPEQVEQLRKSGEALAAAQAANDGKTTEPAAQSNAGAGESFTPEQRTAAVEIVKNTGRLSVMSIQRRMRMGYTRAATLAESLADELGYVRGENGQYSAKPAAPVEAAKPPELMTPDDIVQIKDDIDRRHIRLVTEERDDIAAFGPDSAEAKESASRLREFELEHAAWVGAGRTDAVKRGNTGVIASKRPPKGYVREGDRYVFKGDTAPSSQPSVAQSSRTFDQAMEAIGTTPAGTAGAGTKTDQPASKPSVDHPTKRRMYHFTSKDNDFDSIQSGSGRQGGVAGFLTPNAKFDTSVLANKSRGEKRMSFDVDTADVFDYENPDHVRKLWKAGGISRNAVRSGAWDILEANAEKIRALGFKGFYVKEGIDKNLALLDSSIASRNREDESSASPELMTPDDVSGLDLFHGGLPASASIEDIDLGRVGTQQTTGKQGKTWGGFYLSTKSPRSKAWADNYADQRGGVQHRIRLRPNARVAIAARIPHLAEKENIDRLTAEERAKLAEKYDAVVGKDAIGREQVVLLNKNAVESFTPGSKVGDRYVFKGDTANEGVQKPRADELGKSPRGDQSPGARDGDAAQSGVRQDEPARPPAPVEEPAAPQQPEAEREGVAPSPAPAAPSADFKSVSAFTKAALAGKKTAKEIQDHFRWMLANEDAVKAGILDALDESPNHKRRRKDTKQKIAEKTFDDQLQRLVYAGGEGFTWQPGQETVRQGIERGVMALTDEQIKAKREERLAQSAEHQKAITNPETLAEYQTFVAYKGEDKLTADQRRIYDELRAERGMAQREERKIEEKATVQAVAGAADVPMEIVERTHSKRGHAVFIVTMGSRVDGDTFKELAAKARKLGGNWSREWKPTNSPAGFMFNRKEDADSFMALRTGAVDRKESVVADREESKEAAADRLSAMADKMEADANEELNRDRKTNTHKRAGQADAAIGRAMSAIAFAKTLRNIAEMVRDGRAKFLKNMRTRTQVEALESALRDGMRERDKAESIPYEKAKDRPAVDADVDMVKYPVPAIYGENAGSLANDLAAMPGGKLLAMQVRKLQGPKGMVEIPRAMAEKIVAKKVKYTAWTIESAMTDIKRLAAMNITNDAELRSAIREYMTAKAERAQENPVTKLRRWLVGTKIPGYFPTPPALVSDLLDKADIRHGMSVLEPSAGDGQIADAIKGAHPDSPLAVVEYAQTLREILTASGHNLVAQDFMEYSGPQVDRIVMNPPFEEGQDMDHIRHAYDLLKPGGRLVAIMSEGPYGRSDKKSVAFREWMDDVGGQSERNPDGSFEDASMVRTTGVATRTVVIDKPVEKQAERKPEASAPSIKFKMASALTGKPVVEPAAEPEQPVGKKGPILTPEMIEIQGTLNRIEDAYRRQYGDERFQYLSKAARDLTNSQWIELHAKLSEGEPINEKPSYYPETEEEAGDLVHDFVQEIESKQAERESRGDVFQVTRSSEMLAERDLTAWLMDHKSALVIESMKRFALDGKPLGYLDGAEVYYVRQGSMEFLVSVQSERVPEGHQYWLTELTDAQAEKVEWVSNEARLIGTGKEDEIPEPAEAKEEPAAQPVKATEPTAKPTPMAQDTGLPSDPLAYTSGTMALSDALKLQNDARLREGELRTLLASAKSERDARAEGVITTRKTRRGWMSHNPEGSIKASANPWAVEQYKAAEARYRDIEAMLQNHLNEQLRFANRAVELAHLSALVGNKDANRLSRLAAAVHRAYIETNKEAPASWESALAEETRKMAQELYPDAVPSEMAELMKGVHSEAGRLAQDGHVTTIEHLREESTRSPALMIGGLRLARVEQALTDNGISIIKGYGTQRTFAIAEGTLPDDFKELAQSVVVNPNLTNAEVESFIGAIPGAMKRAKAAFAKDKKAAEEKAKADAEEQARIDAMPVEDAPVGDGFKPIEIAKKPGVVDTLLRFVMPKKSTLPVLTSIRVQDGKAMATDLDLTVEMPMKLADGLYVAAGKNWVKSDTSMDEYPASHEPIKKPKVSVTFKDADAFKLALAQTVDAASDSPTRRVIGGVIINVSKSSVDVLATDGRRLHLIPVDGKATGEGAFTIPTRTVQAILKSNGGGPITIKADTSADRIEVDDGNSRIHSRTPGGTPPNYKAVIPDANKQKISVVVSRKAFGQAVKDVIPFINADPDMAGEGDSLRILISKDGVEVSSARGRKTYWRKRVVPAKSVKFNHLKEPIEMALNAEYLMDMLRSSDSDTVEVSAENELSPIMLKDGKGGRYAVLMPMRVKAAGDLMEGKPAGITADQFDEAMQSEAGGIQFVSEGVWYGRFDDADDMVKAAVESGSGNAASGEAYSDEAISVPVGALSPEIISRMHKILNRDGYAIRDAADVRDGLYKRGVYKNGEIRSGAYAAAYREAQAGIQERVTRLQSKRESQAKSPHVDRQRVRELGYTTDFREAGYITPDGRLIDLSGKREGGSPGQRAYDHREVGGTAGMHEFMAEGNIRINGGHGDIDIMAPPTPKQMRVIEQLARDVNGEITLDLANGLGEWDEKNESYRPKITSKTYSDGALVRRILNDISGFYEMPRFYLTDTGKARAVTIGKRSYFFLDRYDNASQAAGDIREEAGHRLINEMAGSEWHRIGFQAYRGKWSGIRSEIERNYGVKEGSPEFAHELIAKAYRDRMQNVSAWRRFLDALVSAVKDMARKAGMKLALSDAEIRNRLNGWAAAKVAAGRRDTASMGNTVAYARNDKRGSGRKITEPMLALMRRDGYVMVEPERDRFHKDIWGETQEQTAAARVRYDPATATITWTDRDDARDPEAFYRIEDAIIHRGGKVEKHMVLGGGRISEPAPEAFSLSDKSNEAQDIPNEKDPITGATSVLLPGVVPAKVWRELLRQLGRLERAARNVIQGNGGGDIQRVAEGIGRAMGVPVFSGSHRIYARERGLIPVTVGSEHAVYRDAESSFVYRMAQPRTDGGHGVALSVQREAVGSSGDNRLRLSLGSDDLPGFLRKLAVLAEIGGGPSELVGVSDRGVLVFKQPFRKGVAAADVQSLLPVERERMRAVELPEGMAVGVEGPVWITYARGKHWLVADLHKGQFVKDAAVRARIVDAVLSPISAEQIESVPGLSALADEAKAMYDASPDSRADASFSLADEPGRAQDGSMADDTGSRQPSSSTPSGGSTEAGGIDAELFSIIPKEPPSISRYLDADVYDAKKEYERLLDEERKALNATLEARNVNGDLMADSFYDGEWAENAEEWRREAIEDSYRDVIAEAEKNWSNAAELKEHVLERDAVGGWKSTAQEAFDKLLETIDGVEASERGSGSSSYFAVSDPEGEYIFKVRISDHRQKQGGGWKVSEFGEGRSGNADADIVAEKDGYRIHIKSGNHWTYAEPKAKWSELREAILKAIPSASIKSSDTSAPGSYGAFSLATDRQDEEGSAYGNDQGPDAEAGTAAADFADDPERSRVYAEDEAGWQGWLDLGKSRLREQNDGASSAGFQEAELDLAFGRTSEFRAEADYNRSVGLNTVPVARESVEFDGLINDGVVYLARPSSASIHSLADINRHELGHWLEPRITEMRNLAALVDVNSPAAKAYKMRLIDLHTASFRRAGMGEAAARAKAIAYADKVLAKELAADHFAGITRKYGVTIRNAFSNGERADKSVSLIKNTLSQQSPGDAGLFMSMRDARVTPAQDAAYMKAVEAGDTATAQKMVDEAAKAAGYDVGPVWHGTPDGRFLKEQAVFKSQKDRFGWGKDTGVHWFADSKKTAATYADDRRAFDFQNAEPMTIPAYIKLSNPLVIDGKGDQWRTAQTRGRTTDAITEALENGNDGVIVRNVQDDYQTGPKGRSVPTATYAVFSSNAIKSADPVTYDEQGNVIPLSKRFNAKQDDIRFSMRDDLDAKRLNRELGQLIQDYQRSLDNMGRATAIEKGMTKAEQQARAGRMVEKTKETMRERIERIKAKAKAEKEAAALGAEIYGKAKGRKEGMKEGFEAGVERGVSDSDAAAVDRLQEARKDAGLDPLKNPPKTSVGAESAFIRMGKMLGRIDGITQAAKASDDIAALRADLIDLIKNNAPMAIRGRFLTMVSKAKTNADFMKAALRVHKAVEDYQKRVLVGQIKDAVKELNSAARAGKAPIAVDYIGQINELLEGYDFSKPTEATVDRLKELRDFVERERAAGRDVTIPGRILAHLDRLKSKPLVDVELAMLIDLNESIEELIALGDTKLRAIRSIRENEIQRVIDAVVREGGNPMASAKMELEDVQAEIDETLRMGQEVPDSLTKRERALIRQVGIRTPGKRLSETLGPGASLAGISRKAKDAIAIADMRIEPIDVILNRLDGNKGFTGPIYRHLKQRVDSFFAQYLNADDAVMDRLNDAVKRLGITWRESERVGVYAVDIQESGREKLLNAGYSESDIDAIRGSLTENEKQFYRFMRDELQAVFPAIREVMRLEYNVDVETVDDYFPFMTDWLMTEKEAARGEAWDSFLVQDQMARQFTPPKRHVEKGFTIGRVGAGKQAVQIDAVSVFRKHMQDALYLVHMGPTIAHVGRVSGRDEFRQAVGDYGARIIADWADSLSRRGGVPGQRIKWLDVARRNMGAATLGFKLVTAAIQLTPIVHGMSAVGPVNGAFGLGRVLGSRQWRKFLAENMPEVRHRAGDDPSYQAEGDGGWMSRMQQRGYIPLKKLDLLSASVIAAGGYAKSIKRAGFAFRNGAPDQVYDPKGRAPTTAVEKAKKQAILDAELAVRRTQASGSFKDAPPLLTRGRFVNASKGSRSAYRLIFQFQNFAMNLLSYLRNEGLGSEGIAKTGAVWLFFLASVASTSGIREGYDQVLKLLFGFDDDDEDYAEEFKNDLLNSLPGVGSILGAARYNSIPIPVVDQFVNIWEGAMAVANGKEADTKARGFLKLADSTSRLLIGMPGTAEIVGWIRRSGVMYGDEGKKRRTIEDSVKDVGASSGYGEINQAINTAYAKAMRNGLVQPGQDAKQGFTQSWLNRYSREYGEESLSRYRRMKQLMKD